MAINERATVEVQVNGNQAKQELKNLESYANSLKGRLVEAYKSGDTKQIKKLEAELKKTNVELKTMRTNAKNIDVAMNNIGVATPKELRNLLKDINAKLNSGHVKRGSAEWKKYQEQIKLVNAEIRKVNAEIKETESWLTRFNNKFSKWGALVASSIAALTGASLALSKMRNDRNEKESSAANLKALTGLDDASIQWLTRQAEILSTAMDKTGLRVTQSSKDILEAYMLVGSAKPDLLSNKEALNEVTIEAMRLSQAAKMDLKEAVDAVTLSMNQYGASADKAAIYTNVMAAGSKYGSAAVQSITAAVTKAGVSASGANVSIEELVGTIETLAEKGIKDEVAGTGLKMFFLRLQTGADDTNPKIVGLQQALRNLQKLSVEEVVKRFGAETYTVAKTLIDGADKVDYYTKAVTGTNVAMEQAAINSNTAEARMAQLKNQMKESGILLMEKLNPSLSMLTGWGTKLIKLAPVLIDFIKEYGAIILWCSSVLLIYGTRLKLLATYHTIVNTITKTSTILFGAYRVASVALNDALAGDVKSLARFARQMRSTNIATKLIAASTMLYRAVVELLTLRLKGASTAMKGFWTVMKGGPIGALIAVLVAVAGSLYLFTRRASEARRAQALLNEMHGEAIANISAEKTEIEALYKIAKDETKSKEERLKAIKRLNEISPEYLGALNLETIGTDNARIAVDNYVASLLILAEIESAKSRLTDTDRQLDELRRKQSKYLEERETFLGAIKALPRNIANMLTFGGVENSGKKINSDIQELEKQKEQLKTFLEEKIHAKVKVETVIDTSNEKKCPKCGNYPCTCKNDLSDKKKQKILKEQLKEKEAAAAKEEANIKARYARGEMTYRDYCKAINENDIKELEAKMTLYDKESNEYNQLLSKKLDLEKAGLAQETKFTIEEIDARIKAEEIALVSSYNEQKISRYALNEGLFQLDMKALKQKQALYTKDSKEWHDYEKQIVDLDNNENLRKQKEYQELLASIRDEYSKKNLEQLMNDELDGIELLHKKGLLEEEEYQKLRKAIRIKYLKEKIDQADNTNENTSDPSFTDVMFKDDLSKLKDKYALINDAEKHGAISHREALQQKAEADAAYLDNLKAKTEVLYSSLGSIVSSYSNYTNACQDLEIAKVERKYDAEIEAAGSNTTKGKRLEEQKQKDVAKIKTKYNKKAMQIEVAQALASTAMAAINAYSSAAEVPLIGYILAPIAAASALAAGMLQVATIKKQHQAQQAGYYSGGFTASGDYRKEVGVVHAGEFVADHRAVNNANILPVLRLIDNAQKNNTIGSLTTADVSRVLIGTSPVRSTYDNNATGHPDNEALIGMLGYTYTVIEKLQKRLDEPFITVNTVDGEYGIKQAMDKYEQTIKIKSR